MVSLPSFLSVCMGGARNPSRKVKIEYIQSKREKPKTRQKRSIEDSRTEDHEVEEKRTSLPAVVNQDGGSPHGDKRRKPLIEEPRTDDHEIEEARTKIAQPLTNKLDESPLGVERRMLQIKEKRTDDYEHEESRTNRARRYQPKR